MVKKKVKVKANYLSAFQWDLENDTEKLLEAFLNKDESVNELQKYLGFNLSANSATLLVELVEAYNNAVGSITWDSGEAKKELNKTKYDDLKKDVIEKAFSTDKDPDITPSYKQLEAAEKARTNPSPMGAI